MAERFAIEAELLTTIFTGRMTDSTIPVPGWNGGGLGRRLRARFALDLLALKPEDAELYEEDEDIVHFGMLKLVEEMQDLALKILFDKDEQGRGPEPASARLLCEVVRASLKFLGAVAKSVLGGCRRPNPIFDESR